MLTRPSHLCSIVSTQKPKAATPLITPSNSSPRKPCIYSTCLYLFAARSLSIAARSRSLDCLHLASSFLSGWIFPSRHSCRIRCTSTSGYRRIDGFCHSPYAQLLQDMLFGFALYIHQHLVKGTRDRLRGLDVEYMPVFLGEFDKRQQLFFIGRIMYPVREGDSFLVDLHLPRVFGNGAVGQQHELFDQLVGLLVFLYHDPDRFTLFIETETHFARREIDRPLPEAVAAHTLCDGMQQLDLGLVYPRFLFDDLLHLFVGEAVIGVDRGPAHPDVFHVPLRCHAEYGGKGQLVLMRTQRAELIRYP